LAVGTLGAVAFADRVLDDDENLLAEVRPHPVFVLPPLLLLLVAAAAAAAIVIELPRAPVAVAWVLAAMIGLPALWFLARLVRWRAIRLLVTSSRLVYRKGVVATDVVQLRLQRVTEVHCRQTLAGRLVGSGRLVFEVAGDSPLAVYDVRRPRSLQRLVNSQLDLLGTPALPGRPPVTPVGAQGRGRPAVPPGGFAGSGSGPWARPVDVWTVQATPPRGVLLGRGATAPDRASIPDRLVQLDELRRRGILSDAEFDAKKAELLQRL
jgi:membrane protein YdbS with pleckstrin-like domain